MRWVTISAVGLAALALAGCGGSNNASSNTTTTTSTTTTTTTTTAPSTTTSSTTTTASGSGSGVFATGKCRDLAASVQKIGHDFQAAGGGVENLGTVANEYQAFAKTVPSEIRSDVQTIADAVTKYANALQGVHLTAGQTPSAADLLKIQAALKSINQQKLQAAEQNISAWTKKNC
jgi:hypothetical protein